MQRLLSYEYIRSGFCVSCPRRMGAERGVCRPWTVVVLAADEIHGRPLVLAVLVNRYKPSWWGCRQSALRHVLSMNRQERSAKKARSRTRQRTHTLS